jgi:protein ImuA
MSHNHLQHFPLKQGRTHEVCGAGALVFACAAAAQGNGPVIWVREGWKPDSINPLGVGRFFDPERFLLAKGKDAPDVLAVGEEALRSGAVPLVVLEIGKPLGLTAGRRLQLAAEAGQSTGLCIIPDGMGSNAAETRWSCSPVFDPNSASGDSTLQRWEIIKNKTGTLYAWDIKWDVQTRRVIVVSGAARQQGLARASG